MFGRHAVACQVSWRLNQFRTMRGGWETCESTEINDLGYCVVECHEFCDESQCSCCMPSLENCGRPLRSPGLSPPTSNIRRLAQGVTLCRPKCAAEEVYGPTCCEKCLWRFMLWLDLLIFQLLDAPLCVGTVPLWIHGLWRHVYWETTLSTGAQKEQSWLIFGADSWWHPLIPNDLDDPI